MEAELKKQIFDFWKAKWNESTVEGPFDQGILSECERQYGAIPEDYKWFLTTCGSGFLSHERLNSLIMLADPLSFGYNSEFLEGLLFGLDGNIYRKYFILGIDYDNNTFALLSDGRVVTFLLDDVGKHKEITASIFSEDLASFFIAGLS